MTWKLTKLEERFLIEVSKAGPAGYTTWCWKTLWKLKYKNLVCQKIGYFEPQNVYFLTDEGAAKIQELASKENGL